jgi:hypothetical protein
MARETRANLIFLGLFLAVALPGAVMLFKKMQDPMAKRMALPDSVRRRVVYMAPLNAPAVVTRFEPPVTAAWVAGVAREQGGIAEVLSERWRPVTSDDHVVQVVGIQNGTSGATVYLIDWEGGAAEYSVRVDGAGGAGQVRAVKAVPIPISVRREIMDGGYIRPPAAVNWVEVTFAGKLEAGRPVTIRVGRGDRVSAVKLFSETD